MRLDNVYVQTILKKIVDGEFLTKEELVEFLKKLLHSIQNDETLFNKLCEDGVLTRADANHIDFIKYFVDYYNKLKEDEINLNLDDIVSIEVNEKKYIKYKDKDGNYRLIEDNENNKNFVEQIKEKQDQSIIYNESSGADNAQEIMEDLTKERKEYELESISTINRESLTEEQIEDLKKIENDEILKDKEFVFNAELDIYVDVNTGDSYYIYINNEGIRTLRRTDDNYTKTEVQELDYTAGVTMETSVKVEAPTTVEEMDNSDLEYQLRNMSDEDLEYALENEDKLTEAQAIGARAELERRNEKNLEKGKVKVLTRQLNKPYNGFTSLLAIGLITSMYGAGFLIYLFLLVK